MRQTTNSLGKMGKRRHRRGTPIGGAKEHWGHGERRTMGEIHNLFNTGIDPKKREEQEQKREKQLVKPETKTGKNKGK